MAYYDTIAKKWHSATGYRGGPLKEFLLNDLLIGKIPDLSGRSILELGAGNGYFLPLLMRRRSGQIPNRIVVTDASAAQLDMAKTHFRIDSAEYLRLDARSQFPFEQDSFDIVLSTMMFNEVSDSGLKKALGECSRILSDKGLLIISVIHPEFVDNLDKRDALRNDRKGLLTMPGSKDLRVPVVRRSVQKYERLCSWAGFSCKKEEMFPNEKVLNARPGLRDCTHIPLICVFSCSKDNSPS